MMDDRNAIESTGVRRPYCVRCTVYCVRCRLEAMLFVISRLAETDVRKGSVVVRDEMWEVAQ